MRDPVTITIKDGESDLTVRITPMSAVKSEAWLLRVAFALGTGINEVSTDMKPEQMLGCLLRADYDKVKPLLDDLLTCCERVTEGGATIAMSPATIDGMIQYPTTLFTIRVCVLKATFGFFTNGGWSNFLKALRGALLALH